jgi:hypothetical protein
MHARHSLTLGLALLAAQLLTGCSAFQSHQKLDAGPFAENTVSMAGETQRYNRPPQWIYLNEFRTRPAVEAARQQAVVLRDLLRGIALYSTQVVALHESNLAEKKKVAEFAGFIDEVSRPGILAKSTVEIGLDDAAYRSTLADVRSKPTLREALGAAQPLVTAVGQYANRLFDRADESVANAGEDLKEQIDQKFRTVLDDVRDIDAVQMRLTKSFALLHDVRSGTHAALAPLLEIDPELREWCKADGDPSMANLDAAEGHVVAQLGHVKQVRDQLEPQFLLYKEHQKELEALRLQTEEMLRLGRMTLLVWTRSHRNLAAGIPIPPAIDLSGILLNAAKIGKQVL